MISRNILFATIAILLLFLMSAFSVPVQVPDESTSSQFTKRARGTPPPGSKLQSKKSDLTYYWDAFESTHSGSSVAIKTCRGKTLASVIRSFAVEMKTEGTGVARNGRVFNFGDCNCGSGFSCFEELDNDKFPFGIAANGKALRPYATVATNDIKLGTKLYLKEIDGVKLPTGETHNGCVIADDTGHGFGGRHIDWFVSKETNFDKLDKKLNLNSVTVFIAPQCNILNYG